MFFVGFFLFCCFGFFVGFCLLVWFFGVFLCVAFSVRADFRSSGGMHLSNTETGSKSVLPKMDLGNIATQDWIHPEHL